GGRGGHGRTAPAPRRSAAPALASAPGSGRASRACRRVARGSAARTPASSPCRWPRYRSRPCPAAPAAWPATGWAWGPRTPRGPAQRGTSGTDRARRRSSPRRYAHWTALPALAEREREPGWEKHASERASASVILPAPWLAKLPLAVSSTGPFARSFDYQWRSSSLVREDLRVVDNA